MTFGDVVLDIDVVGCDVSCKLLEGLLSHVVGVVADPNVRLRLVISEAHGGRFFLPIETTAQSVCPLAAVLLLVLWCGSLAGYGVAGFAA